MKRIQRSRLNTASKKLAKIVISIHLTKKNPLLVLRINEINVTQ